MQTSLPQWPSSMTTDWPIITSTLSKHINIPTYNPIMSTNQHGHGTAWFIGVFCNHYCRYKIPANVLILKLLSDSSNVDLGSAILCECMPTRVVGSSWRWTTSRMRSWYWSRLPRIPSILDQLWVNPCSQTHHQPVNLTNTPALSTFNISKEIIL